MGIRAMAAAVTTAAVLGTGLVLGPAAVAGTGTVQLTGAQLLSALVPASAFPAGYKSSPGGTYSSGKRLETGPAKYHLSTMSCTSFGDDFGSKGFGETATAGDGYEQAGEVRSYGQQVYQFRTSAVAASFFNGLRAIIHRCPAFILSGAGSKVTTRVFGIARIAGGRTFQADSSGSMGARITVDLVFTVIGPDVFLDGAIGITVAPPASPSLRTIMLKLIDRVHAYR